MKRTVVIVLAFIFVGLVASNALGQSTPWWQTTSYSKNKEQAITCLQNGPQTNDPESLTACGETLVRLGQYYIVLSREANQPLKPTIQQNQPAIYNGKIQPLHTLDLEGNN